jgi:hypothetical protein
VDPGHQPGLPEASEQLYAQQDDGCDQEPRGFAQKLELFSFNGAKTPIFQKCGAFFMSEFCDFPPFFWLFFHIGSSFLAPKHILNHIFDDFDPSLIQISNFF